MMPRRTSRAGLVADVIDIRTRRAVSDLEAVLAEIGFENARLRKAAWRPRFGLACSFEQIVW